MVNDLKEVARGSLRVSLNDNTIACPQSACFYEIVGMGFFWSSAGTGIRFDSRFLRLSIQDEFESLPFEWEE